MQWTYQELLLSHNPYIRATGQFERYSIWTLLGVKLLAKYYNNDAFSFVRERMAGFKDFKTKRYLVWNIAAHVQKHSYTEIANPSPSNLVIITQILEDAMDDSIADSLMMPPSQTQGQTVKLTYRELARELRKRHCAIDVDRVYGVLAVLERGGEIEVRYDKELAEVYSDMASKKLIGLEAMSGISISHTAGLCWVGDFAAPGAVSTENQAIETEGLDMGPSGVRVTAAMARVVERRTSDSDDNGKMILRDIVTGGTAWVIIDQEMAGFAMEGESVLVIDPSATGSKPSRKIRNFQWRSSSIQFRTPENMDVYVHPVMVLTGASEGEMRVWHKKCAVGGFAGDSLTKWGWNAWEIGKVQNCYARL